MNTPSGQAYNRDLYYQKLHKRLSMGGFLDAPVLRHKVTVNIILKTIEELFGVPSRLIRGPRRYAALSRYRKAACWMAVHWTSLSLTVIGRAMGGRDHSTIWSANKAVEDRPDLFDEVIEPCRAALKASGFDIIDD